MGIEDSESAFTRKRFQRRKGNLPPIRSGSAPPSIEGSFAAIENRLFRLPPPLTSGEDTGSSSRSIWLDHAYISTNEEGSGDDGSLTQEDPPQAQSSASNQSAGNYADSNSTTTTVSRSPSTDRIGGNMLVDPPVTTSLNARSQDHGSISSVADADISAIRNGMASLDISNFLKLENENENAHAGPHPQTMPLPQPQPYAGTNPFPQNPAIFLPSLGFTAAHYATHPGYMTSETPLYPNMMPTGYFPQQYAIGGYAFNPPPIFPYATGYLPNNPFPTPVGNIVPSVGGQSQTSGVNVQQVNNLLLQDHILQSLGLVSHSNSNSRSVGTANPYYLRSPTNMNVLQFSNLPSASPLLPESPIGGVRYPGRRSESVYGGWKGHTSNYVSNDPKTNLLLEQLKTGKGRSVDQYGSRFIQQKLEVCSNEEREAVFEEVFPHASKLITDVFGNYVIQKILEHGNAEQRRGLGNLFEGQVLPLSLQMYGCRVIQKALDVFELEQRIKIFHELEGHILKCVRDQNGNHRVLEHSTDKLQSQFIVDEILAFVYDLAQDQFGNYVTQYVLEAGKTEERRQIVDKLVGHIVRLSQHKFASNVIEKCLEYGDEATTKIIIEEIIGSADGNDNLLVMLKDKYANYVVQKVLQICSGHQREVLLSRMKVHLNLLRNYTYGKHIVARFEQLYSKEIEASSSNSQRMSDGNLYSSSQSV
ncbi:hypothetical protein M8C21_010199 [Ambrosia artemisiifolia]|uniref:PUM-HD domain-containing protein n=1 Tax=Ambrosia artemisiifolia TaxID=4212 RepID=A0AAD5CSQ8_AMBAR|nr:hypothetical protein M8C21_010199 [Ambrosia artemisiifolia]